VTKNNKIDYILFNLNWNYRASSHFYLWMKLGKTAQNILISAIKIGTTSNFKICHLGSPDGYWLEFLKWSLIS
jgi:hypothetical protein